VQTANQRLLQNELQNLLRTLSISSADLLPLKEASLTNLDGVKETEAVLSTLYQAMLMIDSDVQQNKKRIADAAGVHSSISIYADNDVGQMRAIREKKEEYRTEARLFLQRLTQFMSVTFKVVEQKISNAVMDASSKNPLKLDNTALDYVRQELWMYNSLMLFARDVSTTEWRGIIGLYEQQVTAPYQNIFRDNYVAWKALARKTSGDEHDLLFAHHDKEKESDGITTAARKLTVRRGKTIRVTGGPRVSPADKQTGKIEPYETFSGILQETLKMISEEQNFIVQFFHLSSLANADFPDVVSSAAPEERRKPSLNAMNQTHDPDRERAKKVEQIVGGIYSFWPNDIQSLADWAMQGDPL
jgi:exocyst complex component 1